MQITEVKVFPIQEDKLKAFVSVVFDGCFMVNDIKVIQGREGLFISMPSRKKKNGEFKDVAHPLNNETRRMIETRILAEYEQAVKLGGAPLVSGRDRSEAGLDTSERPAVTHIESPMPQESLAAKEGKSLDEIEELHLRDSFWSVT